MAEARILDVRDAVITAINADETIFGDPVLRANVQAAASYLPEYRLANLTVMQVDVRMVREDTEASDRAPSSEDVYHLEITVQKEVSPYDPDKLDKLVSVGKRIAKLFYPNMQVTMANSNPVVVISNDHELYDIGVLRDFGVFLTRIELALGEFVSD